MIDHSPYRLWSIAGELNSFIVGSKIQKVCLPHWIDGRYKKNRLPGMSPLLFTDWRFESIETYGKSLILKIEKEGESSFIGCDLGVGRWITQEKTASSFYKCSDSIYLFLEMFHSDGYEYNLIFYDKMRRGKIEIRQNVHEIELLNRYGPAIDSPHFTRDWLDFVIRRTRSNGGKPPARVHTVLYQQRYFAGMTNRMISEICFLSNIFPETLINDMTEEQIIRLYHSILIVFSSFARIKRQYEYMIWSKVDCPVCETKIKKSTIRNLAAYYCPVCQDPNFKNPQPISAEFVNEILRISRLSTSVGSN
jgi:formamidopyrimidine-DNA glycosylase